MGSIKTETNDNKKAVRGTARYRYIQIAIVLSGVSVFAQLYLFQPLLPELGREFALTPAISSLSVSAGTAGMAVGLFTLAFWADVLPRKQLMTASMFAAALLTLITALSPNFATVVAIMFLKGMAISGISAVALAYLAEEVAWESLGVVVSLYLSGNTFGGMWGRVFSNLAAEWGGWRWATVLIGGIGLLMALLFKYLLPLSNHFESKQISTSYKIRQMRIFLRDRVLLCMFCIAALMMGTFVSIYNYLSFRLEAPPFSLPSYIIASVFLMYMVGIAGR
jgi:YNFM family putative membrane transporter